MEQVIQKTDTTGRWFFVITFSLMIGSMIFFFLSRSVTREVPFDYGETGDRAIPEPPSSLFSPPSKATLQSEPNDETGNSILEADVFSSAPRGNYLYDDEVILTDEIVPDADLEAAYPPEASIPEDLSVPPPVVLMPEYKKTHPGDLRGQKPSSEDIASDSLALDKEPATTTQNQEIDEGLSSNIEERHPTVANPNESEPDQLYPEKSLHQFSPDKMLGTTLPRPQYRLSQSVLQRLDRNDFQRLNEHFEFGRSNIFFDWRNTKNGNKFDLSLQPAWTSREGQICRQGRLTGLEIFEDGTPVYTQQLITGCRVDVATWKILGAVGTPGKLIRR